MGKIIKTLSIVTVLFALSGCYLDFPSYELESRITSVNTSGNTVTVYYSLENIGYESMDNVQIVVEVQDINENVYSSRSVNPFDWENERVNLSPGEEYYGSVVFYLYSTYEADSAVIVSVGWDSDDEDGSWF